MKFFCKMLRRDPPWVKGGCFFCCTFREASGSDYSTKCNNDLLKSIKVQ